MGKSDRASGVNVRMPKELRIWVGVEAAKALRSINSEIVLRLEAARAADLAKDAPAAGEALPA